MSSLAQPAGPLDAQDLQRKLRTVDALRSYEKCCTGTLLLDAVESERQLRVRLSSLEPLYKSLQAKHSENERYIDELEKLAEGATVESKDHNAQLRGLRGENAVLKGKIDSLEDELRELHESTHSSTAELSRQHNEAVGALAKQQTECELVRERCKELEAELQAATAARAQAEAEARALGAGLKYQTDSELKAVRADLAKALREAGVLQGKFTAASEEAARRLEEAKDAAIAHNLERKVLEEQLAEHLSEKKSLKEQIVTLSHSLNLEKRASARVADAAAQDSEAPKLKSEILVLSSALKQETKAREKAQKELAKAQEDWEAKHKGLEAKLETTQKKLKAARTTKVPVENPRKRGTGSSAHLTMQDLERSAKRPRQKTPPKASDFSLTPFLKKQAQVIADSPDNSRTDDARATGEESIQDDAGDRSIMVPAVIESTNPTRLLLAGAGRRTKLSTRPEAVPEAEEAPSSRPPSEAEDEEIEEDSILMAPPPKVKAKAKAKSTTAKKTTATETSILSSLAEAKKEAASKPKKKTKKQNGETSFMGGIRPTLFNDDDGTGRLEVILDDASQEPRGKGRLKLPPSNATAFTKEISPPKKRPDALKKFQIGKK